MKKIIVYIIVFIVFLSMPGCFKQVVETQRSLPDIIWPKPPAIPRIRLVNAVSGPEDLRIRGGIFKNILRFLKGETYRPIVNPYGITTNDEGAIFVVDNYSRIVHVMDPRNNQYYSFPDGETILVSPIDVAIDGAGTIYVSDSKEAVIKIFSDNGKKYAGEIGREFLNRPTGLAVNRKTGELLVVDTMNAEIVRYDTTTRKVLGILGREGSTRGLFHYPTHIAVTPDGLILVSDSLNFRIQVLSPDGTFIRTFGEVGDSPGFFARPKGVAVDSDGNIYVVDALFDNVQIFDSNGNLLINFGSPGNSYGEFWLPSGIYIDEHDTIYVSDSYNHRVQIFQYMKGEEFLKSH